MSCTNPNPSSEEDPVISSLRSNQHPHQIFVWHNAIRQHFEAVDSTQVQAKRLIDVLPRDRWLILSADEQTAGMGTHSRRWISPPHVNLYVTFLVPFPRKASEKLFYMSQVATIAIARTVRKVGLAPEIKWPNDLMLHEKKVGGILCEDKTPDLPGDYSVLLIGIGLNVNMDKSLCDSLDQPVTSLCVDAQKTFDKEVILPQLYLDLRNCFDQLLHDGFSSFQEELNSMLAFKGERVIIDKKDGDSLQGTFIGIDEMGRMKLELFDKTIAVLDDGRLRVQAGTMCHTP